MADGRVNGSNRLHQPHHGDESAKYQHRTLPRSAASHVKPSSTPRHTVCAYLTIRSPLASSQPVMKLSDVDIRNALQQGRLSIRPEPPESHCGSFSIDLTLGNTFRVFNDGQHPFIDLASNASVFAMSETLMRAVTVADGEAFYLHPHELALGVTIERVAIPDDLAGRLDGRSSLARLGLMVHITAHTIDPGWDGCITLEFYNSGRFPLALRPGMRICAISFEMLSSPTSKPYRTKQDAKYRNQDSPLASRIDREA